MRSLTWSLMRSLMRSISRPARPHPLMRPMFRPRAPLGLVGLPGGAGDWRQALRGPQDQDAAFEGTLGHQYQARDPVAIWAP